MSEENTRVYELGYLLAPTVVEGDVPAEVDVLVSTIKKAEGEILSQGVPEFIDLAYTMEKDIASKKYKYSQAYFGWVKFEAAPEVLEIIKKSLDANKLLIRYILIKTSVENTVIFKKPKVEAKRPFEADGEVITGDTDLEDDDAMIADHEKLPELTDDIAPEETEAEEA